MFFVPFTFYLTSRQRCVAVKDFVQVDFQGDTEVLRLPKAWRRGGDPETAAATTKWRVVAPPKRGVRSEASGHLRTSAEYFCVSLRLQIKIRLQLLRLMHSMLRVIPQLLTLRQKHVKLYSRWRRRCDVGAWRRTRQHAGWFFFHTFR